LIPNHFNSLDKINVIIEELNGLLDVNDVYKVKRK